MTDKPSMNKRGLRYGGSRFYVYKLDCSHYLLRTRQIVVTRYKYTFCQKKNAAVTSIMFFIGYCVVLSFRLVQISCEWMQA